MIRAIPIVLMAFLFVACSEKSNVSNTSTDAILDVLLKAKDSQSVEFPGLYDHLFYSLPDDASEKLILAEKLKARGFKVAGWGRGNLPPLGPRIVLVTLAKADCECEVGKKYYSTMVDTVYQAVEAISCKTKRK